MNLSGVSGSRAAGGGRHVKSGRQPTAKQARRSINAQFGKLGKSGG